jgi:hypothetical protein
MEFTAQQIADLLQGTIEGDSSVKVKSSFTLQKLHWSL